MEETKEETKEEQKGTQENTENPRKDSISPLTKAIMILVIISVAAFLVISLKNAANENAIKAKCAEIENDPYLANPCKCVPLIDSEDAEMDEVEQKTAPLCRCTCDIGTDNPYIIDIRAAEDE